MDAYTFTLDTAEQAAQLCLVVQRMAAVAETEEVRTRLGHGHLIPKRSSVRYAEAIALEKTKDQPDAPITTREILTNMQMATNTHMM